MIRINPKRPIGLIFSAIAAIGLILTFTPVYAGSVVQTRSGGNNNGVLTTFSLAFTSNVASGNILIVGWQMIDNSGTGSPTSTTDSLGNSYTEHCLINSASEYGCLAYANSGTSGADTVTVHYTCNGGVLCQVGIQLLEATGYTLTGLVNKQNSGTSGSPAVSSTTFSGSPLLVAEVAGGGATGPTSGTGFTNYGGSYIGSWLAEYATSGISSPTTFPFSQSSGGWSTWSEEALVLAAGSSTINLTCVIVESGAPSETLTLSGGSPSPSTAGCSTGSGTTTAITVSPACTLTVTVATDGANTRYRLNSSATSSTTQNITCPGGGGSTSVKIYNYYQLQNTYLATTNGAGPPTWDSGLTAAVTGTVTGVSSTTGCTISPSSGTTSTASCSAWFDYNTAASEPSTMSGAGSNIKWKGYGTCSWTDTTGANTHTCTYYKQLQNTYQVTANAVTNFVNGLSWPVTGTIGGTASSTGCTITSTVASTDSCIAYFDYNLAATVPQTATGAASNTRWQSSAACPFTQTTGGNTNNCNSYLQLQNTYQMSPTNPATWDAGYTETATGSLYGSTGQTICSITLTNGGGTGGCTGYADNNAQVSLSSGFACTGCSPAGTWTPTGTFAWTDTTGGNTHTATYQIIYGSGFILKLTVNQAGAPTLTFSVTGCSASPSTIPGDGNPHTFSSSGSCTVTVTRSDSPQDRVRFTSTGSNTVTFTVNPGTSYSYTFDYQNFVTFAASIPSAATVTPSGSAWYNYGTKLTMSVQILPDTNGNPSAIFLKWESNSSNVIACATCSVTGVTLNGGGDPLALLQGVVYQVLQPNPLTVTFWWFPMVITILFLGQYLLVAARHGASTWGRNYMMVTGLTTGIIMAILTETMPFPMLILGLIIWFLYAYRG